MKKITALILALLLLLSLIGCNSSRKDESGKKLSVICTIFPQYDFLRNIAGDLVDLKMLVPFGMESHDFSLESLTVADVRNIGASQLVVYTGGESDSKWINELKSSVRGNTKWIALTDIVEPLSEIMSDSMNHAHEHEHEHEHGDEHEETDEHVWTSPKRAIEIVDFLADELAELDADNADVYRENAEKYKSELAELDSELESTVSASKRKTLIFADRFPFRYLCADYGLSFDAAFPGCSSSADPSVVQIESLVKSAVEAQAKVIFYMENSKQVYARQIAAKVGAETLLLHSCHQITKEQFNSGISYTELMKNNINNIKEALL